MPFARHHTLTCTQDLENPEKYAFKLVLERLIDDFVFICMLGGLVFTYACLFVCLSVCLRVCVSARLRVYVSARLRVCASARLRVCVSTCLRVCLSV